MSDRIEFDPYQKKAIASLANTVVTAGAGSGKTAVLAERYYWLLTEKKAAVEQICALTFTKKAAREMHERIYKRLLSDSSKPEILGHLAQFKDASIQTIDSFCATIVKNAASLFGLPQDFSYDEQGLGDLASTTGMELLQVHGLKPGIRALIRDNGYTAFIEDLVPEICGNILSLSGDIDFRALHETQLEALGNIRKKLAREFHENVNALVTVWPVKKGSAVKSRETLEPWQKLSLLVEKGMDAGAEALALMREIKLSKPAGKITENNASAKELTDKVRNLKSELETLTRILVKKNDMLDIFLFLQDLQAAFHEKKRSQGKASYRDVLLMAVAALQKDTSLRAWYKRKYRYIMIDEFQDTNIIQKELLYLLAEKPDVRTAGIPPAAALEPDKLFFVGDEKQSIYAFRGADVSVFKNLKTDFGKKDESVLGLPFNYRSHPGLVSFFNRVFSHVMSASQRDYEALFQALLPVDKKAAVQPEIHIFLADKDSLSDDSGDEDDSVESFTWDEREAFTLAKFLRNAIDNGTLMVPRDKGTAPARFRDCAVLMRSTGNQIIMERMFRIFGIPYSTQGVRSLFLEAPVSDMYSLFQSALYPRDRVAYAALLRSPFVNISDTAFFETMTSKKGPFGGDAPAGEDAEKYVLGRKLHEYFSSRIDRVPIAALVTDAWYRFGYRYHILQNPRYHTFLEYYDYFFELARKADGEGRTMAEFLSMIRENLGKYEKLDDLDIIHDDSDSVLVMSIHKAKGLEFPVVIIPNMGNMGRNDPKDPAFAASALHRITVSVGGSNYLYRITRDEENLRKKAELKRLLYVSFTRAESHLVLSGIRSKWNKGSSSCMLALLLSSLGIEAESPMPEPGVGTIPGGEEYRLSIHGFETFDHNDLKNLLKSGKKMNLKTAGRFYENAPLVIRHENTLVFPVSRINREYVAIARTTSQQTLMELPRISADSKLSSDEDRQRFGTLTHFILHQRLSQNISADTPMEKICESLPLVIQAAWQPRVLEELVRAGTGLVKGFFASKWGTIINEADELHSEYPFLMRIEKFGKKFFIDGIIDLYFIHKKRPYLIDFKTDGRLDPMDYQAQMSLYAEAVEELTRQKPEVCLFMLRSGESVPISTEIDRNALFQRLAAVKPDED